MARNWPDPLLPLNFVQNLGQPATLLDSWQHTGTPTHFTHSLPPAPISLLLCGSSTMICTQCDTKHLYKISLAGAARNTIFVATKHVLCRNKSMLVATKSCLSRQIFVVICTCLSRQKLYLHNFVATNTCLSQQNYVCRYKYLSWQMFCRGKHTFVATRDMFCVFVAKIFLSRHKLYLWQLPPMITKWELKQLYINPLSWQHTCSVHTLGVGGGEGLTKDRKKPVRKVLKNNNKNTNGSDTLY